MQAVAVESGKKLLFPGQTNSDGPSVPQRHYFNYWSLRDNCPSSRSSVTRDRAFDITSLKTPPRPVATKVEGDSLTIT